MIASSPPKSVKELRQLSNRSMREELVAAGVGGTIVSKVGVSRWTPGRKVVDIRLTGRVAIGLVRRDQAR
jgi:hypothetical protein